MRKILQKIKKYLNRIPESILNLANILIILCIVFVVFKANNNTIQQSYLVTGPEIKSMAEKIAGECISQNKESCYKNNFKQLIYDHDFPFAIQTLLVLQDIDETTKSCHILSHYMSRIAVEKNPSNWETVLDNVDVNACGSGFLHGVLESHLGDNPDTEFNAELSEEICNRGEDNYRKRMCTHFMGHFFLLSTRDDVEKAVPICDDVSEELKFDCLNGLFMEHNQRIALADHGLAELPVYTPEYARSLEKVCEKYSGIQASACYTEMAEVYAKTFGYDADIIYNNCYKNVREQNAKSCYGKGQTVLSTYPMDLTAKQMTDICKFYTDEGEYKNCIHNVLASLMYYSPKFTARGILLCQNIHDYREWCVTELGRKLKNIVPFPQERIIFCQSAENEKYKNLCAQAG